MAQNALADPDLKQGHRAIESAFIAGHAAMILKWTRLIVRFPVIAFKHKIGP